MKKIFPVPILLYSLAFASCDSNAIQEKDNAANTAAVENTVGQSGVKDDQSQQNVVQVAVGSKDHTILVKAIQTAGLVDALSNAGPFTVFAPTNAAFDKLPAGTVEDLLKPENEDKLTDILQYHVSIGVFKMESFTDGQVIGQVNGDNITIKKDGDKILVNGNAQITGSVPASNGIVYVTDAVLLPPAK